MYFFEKPGELGGTEGTAAADMETALKKMNPITIATAYQVCCSVLQRVAACCSVLQCVAACCSVLQRVAACCSVLQGVEWKRPLRK